jgi:hypothetical protein
MAESAAHLVDHVIPRLPVRQWVVSFPLALRILFAAHPQLLSGVLHSARSSPSLALPKVVRQSAR